MSTERERLMKLMETEGLNAKQFANEVGIQAGTISNIVNGRNKPSLEVLQKVLHRFRTVSSDWMVLDSGSMYRPIGEAQSRTLFDELPVEPPMIVPDESERDEEKNETAQEHNYAGVKEQQNKVSPAGARGEAIRNRKIEKIVVFFDDGTYEQLLPG